MADQPHDDESQDNVGTGAEISTENDVPAIFYDGSDGVPHSGAPQREIYLSELAQSQEDIARLTRTIIRGCDEYGSREHREYGGTASSSTPPLLPPLGPAPGPRTQAPTILDRAA